MQCSNINEENEEESIRKAREAFALHLASADECDELARNRYYRGVDPHGADIRPEFNSNVKMEFIEDEESQSTSIYKIKTEDYEKLFGKINNGESDETPSSGYVILKIYSAWTAITIYCNCFGNIDFLDGEYPPLSDDEYVDYMMVRYEREVSLYQKIEEHNKNHKGDNQEINNIPRLLKHGYCCIKKTSCGGIEGMFLAVEYMPFTQQNRTLMNPVDMREKLESIGIHARHPDYLPKILSVDENDETFIYDFGKAKLKTEVNPHRKIMKIYSAESYV
ncbi:unnamed protein product [Ambrosiozyma monospora]|uniref:Unnamed protein product n=1 Tax=Ambrosiozyma monospora TaxID=43982 RepID=A0A9W6T9H4_AMBMO|nr:unnamed protein product [Ambrosiozyma monospora]